MIGRRKRGSSASGVRHDFDPTAGSFDQKSVSSKAYFFGDDTAAILRFPRSLLVACAPPALQLVLFSARQPLHASPKCMIKSVMSISITVAAKQSMPEEQYSVDIIPAAAQPNQRVASQLPVL